MNTAHRFEGTPVLFAFLLGDSLLHYLGDHFLRSYVGTLLIYIVLPPLLLLGLPNRMMISILHLGLRCKWINFLKYPLIPLLLFNVLFSFYQVPFILIQSHI
ncbi:cytochrome c oxidase assembly protein [Parageobacillus toebii]|nr:cytochrome c oxidase assembly protein [Parageobacillus toebii]QSB47742.1 cytochrome c oxidase assembly protein [Parageobacillus toebii]